MNKIALSLRMTTLVAVLAAVGGAVAACGSGNSALPGTTSVSSSTGSSSTSAVNDMWYLSVDSCGLLSQSQLAELGFTSTGSPLSNTSSVRSCEWTQSQLASFSISLFDATYDSIPAEPGGPLQDITVAGRPGKLTEDPHGSCGLALKATDGSRALIAVTALSGGDQGCTIAKQVAQDIAPKLPALSN